MFNREPILWLAAVQAAIALVTSFGLDMTGEQTGAVMAVSAALLGLVARRRVSPVVDPVPAGDDRGTITLQDIVLVLAAVVLVLLIIRWL